MERKDCGEKEKEEEDEEEEQQEEEVEEEVEEEKDITQISFTSKTGRL